ncbi:MAG: hypothetical protein E6Q36_01325 [Chryseobacterium sp.]|nr:MAG: hypothetical protein E6Q36_01325 [Chryseobacterium sp.]
MFDIQSIKDTIAELNLEEKIAKIKDLHSQSANIRRQINEVTATLTWQQLLKAGMKMEAIVCHCNSMKKDVPTWTLGNSHEFIEGHVLRNQDLYPALQSVKKSPTGTKS